MAAPDVNHGSTPEAAVLARYVLALPLLSSDLTIYSLWKNE